jgi:catechol 2,3-dioxygenase
MAITGVLRPGHVAIRVLEMAPALKHYTEVLGLSEVARDKKGRVFLKAWDEHDHHSVVLREADEAGMDYMGWKVDSPATLKKLATDIEKSKLCQDLEWIPAGEHPETGERFRFTIPTGHLMELYAEKKYVGNNCGTDGQNVNPDPWPDLTIPHAGQRPDFSLTWRHVHLWPRVQRGGTRPHSRGGALRRRPEPLGAGAAGLPLGGLAQCAG